MAQNAADTAAETARSLARLNGQSNIQMKFLGEFAKHHRETKKGMYETARAATPAIPTRFWNEAVQG